MLLFTYRVTYALIFQLIDLASIVTLVIDERY